MGDSPPLQLLPFRFRSQFTFPEHCILSLLCLSPSSFLLSCSSLYIFWCFSFSTLAHVKAFTQALLSPGRFLFYFCTPFIVCPFVSEQLYQALKFFLFSFVGFCPTELCEALLSHWFFSDQENLEVLECMTVCQTYYKKMFVSFPLGVQNCLLVSRKDLETVPPWIPKSGAQVP